MFHYRGDINGFVIYITHARMASATFLASCHCAGKRGVAGDRCSSGGLHSQRRDRHQQRLAGCRSQYERVVREVLPSVVQITTGTSTGSGIVYDHKGDIVTNEHVIGTAKTVRVQESVGNTTLTAKVVGQFAADDLEVIRVEKDAGSLKPAKFADSNNAQIGEIVLAMGNPLGLTDSVTQGIVSATGRTVGSSEPNGGTALITPAIQTSAAINPGNSGGALVDLNGHVIGIPTLAAQLPGKGGAAPGIGFAIPSDTVRNIADQLIKSGRVASSGQASLGITAQTAASPSGHAVGVAVLGVAGARRGRHGRPQSRRHHRGTRQAKGNQPGRSSRHGVRAQAGHVGHHLLHPGRR